MEKNLWLGEDFFHGLDEWEMHVDMVDMVEWSTYVDMVIN